MRSVSIAAIALLLAGTAQAQEPPAPSAHRQLREDAQNPIAKRISVPFQNNFFFGDGEREKTKYVLNVQPVVPVPVSNDWDLIVRPIVPIVDQPKLFDAPDSHHAFGLGDINLQLYLSPSETVETPLGRVFWGIGPSLYFPSATDSLLGSDRWSAGPGGAAFVSDWPFTYGFLANNVWSYAGDDERPEVDQFLLQAFFNYNLEDGWSLSSTPVITANWEAEEGDVWTVPVGGGVGKLFKIGELPIQSFLRAYYNVLKPEHGPDWQLQLQFALLFPR